MHIVVCARRGLLASTLALPLLHPGGARAARWPDRPVRLVIPFGAGGSVDVVGRMLAEKMTPQLGQQLVVDNRPGGGTAIGAQFVARSAPDGYTLFYGTPATQIINPSLMPNLPYDPDKDLVATGSIMRAPNLLLVHPSLGVRDIAGLIALAKRRPGELTFASSNTGSSNHLSGELFNSMAGVQMQHVPFRGFGAYSAELLAGRVHMCFGTISDMLGLSANSSLVRVAVTSAQRSPLLPEVPTVAETVPGFEATAYNYIAVPAGTPRDIIMAVNAAFNRALTEPDIVTRMVATGLEPIGHHSPEQAADTILAERRRWQQVIQAAGIKLEG
ncbi:Bug family tripartite tricarboxylate transporter substrate binding protein [Siccirubricoccus phaeus]|uniref:Bug family tripartite tricarboxylate transporter substrate binding protein n=1 Tax=Siccirubricoccus phaeus TaxID=2595053 RepID=UPI00165CC780|nr:tripartite tricarboxylate transporter substrate binding protein [Siccirubricoccus phaeus]